MDFKVGDRVKVKSGILQSSYCKSGECGIVVEAETETATVKWDNDYKEALRSNICLRYPPCASSVFNCDLVKEDKAMYASELMELARKEPEKYEGKRYKVLSVNDALGAPIRDFEGYIVERVKVFNGALLIDESSASNCTAFIDNRAELEEIPQPVPFMEAVNSRKKFKYFDWDNYYSPSAVMRILASNTNDTVLKLINDNQWLIEA